MIALNTTRLVSAMLMAVILAAVLLSGCQDHSASKTGRRVIILGFDGMDFGLTRRLIDAGELPHLARLAGSGNSGPLETSVPPLSPVAWSEFATGLDAGGHGIFDFIHRDPDTMQPYLSTSRIETAESDWLPSRIKLGSCILPLAQQTQANLRRGRPFWERLEDAGIRTRIIRMPANYPPSGTAFRELSGMGTPDLLGSYGTFSFYGTGLFVIRKSLDGGNTYPVEIEQGRIQAPLFGPVNPFTAAADETSIEFTIEFGSDPSAASLQIADQRVELQAGQWSPWVAFEFELDCIPFVTLPGMVRFYPRQLRPELELYVSPINIDPLNPVQPISTPTGFAVELAEDGGRFYTQGMMEDTKALSAGILTRTEFLAQAALSGQEVEQQYYPLLDAFDDGLLFYYFGNLDQVSHMMHRHQPGVPSSDQAPADPQFADAVADRYRDADRIVGKTLQQMTASDLLIVMSDHGFAPWQRSFHLNAWLREQGYLVLKDTAPADEIDWNRTRAYGLGFNGLYINQQGRERDGIVAPEHAEALVAEIADRLLAETDPVTGRPAITRTYIASQHYKNREHLQTGPDLVVGYARGTRNHSDAAIGRAAGPVFSDNLDEWSGDHAMDHTVVPGVLFTNRPLKQPAGSLRELSASILAEFEQSR